MLKPPIITLVVICRLKSTRLPQKALLPIYGIPSIERCLLNCLAVPHVDHVLLATSALPQDDPLEQFTMEGRVTVIRGDADNVAKRMVQAANLTNANIVLRVTGDNPAVSPEILSCLINDHLKSGVDFTSAEQCAIGTDGNVITVEALHRLLQQPRPLTHTEYLSYYFYHNPHLFTVNRTKLSKEFQYPEWRLTLDKAKDLEMFETLYSGLNVQREPLYFSKLRAFLLENPEISNINAGVSVKYLHDPSIVAELKKATVLG